MQCLGSPGRDHWHCLAVPQWLFEFVVHMPLTLPV